MKKLYLTLVSVLLIALPFAVAQSTHTLDALDYGNPGTGSQFNEIGYSIDGVIIEYNACGASPSIHVVIIDSLTCMALTNCNADFGQANTFIDPNQDCITDNNTIYSCRARPESFFIYRSNNADQMQSMAHLLDSTGNGNYILVYTFLSSNFSSMDTSFSNVLQRLGSTLVTNLADSLPFIFFCKKGDNTSVVETMGTHWGDTISIHATFECATNGIDELSGGSPLVIYPNPVSSELQVQHLAGEILSVKGYDVFGNVVFENTSIDQVSRIDTKALANGFYFIRVNGKNYSANGKFCVMHE